MSYPYSHIYHSPIGAIKISAEENSIAEVIFIEPDQLQEAEINLGSSNAIIHQAVIQQGPTLREHQSCLQFIR